MLESNQLYIIVDTELNGRIPGEHSILSIGAVASTMEEEISSFYKKLQPLEDLTADPETMKRWQTQPGHSHKAIDDARGYGVILRNVLRAARI